MHLMGYVVNSLIFCMIALNLSDNMMSTSILIYRFAKRTNMRYKAKKKIKELEQ
jgi:hypothetical protein